MRTTVELRDDLRAKLLELAARRGQKGYSKLLAEAIESYLESLARDEEKRQAALRLRGTLTTKEAEELRKATRALRESWR
jgi:metal-responsive CopG/Arc/MetJ family transcriptional regulator